MRILQGLMDIAGQPGLLAQALKDLGHKSESWVFATHPFGFRNDRILCQSRSNILLRLGRGKELLEALCKFDIWHLHKGHSFLHDNKDLKIAKQFGKKIVIHYRGREIRPEIGIATIPLKLRNRIENQLKYADIVFVHDAELAQLLQPIYPKTIIFPNIVNIHPNNHRFLPSSKIFRIVHIPSNPQIKGSEFVRKAVSEFSGQVEYIEKTGISHQETITLFQSADLIIDQMLIGTYGNVSLEAMALGKPVICFLREDLQEHFQDDLPIVNATTTNLNDVIKKAYQNRDWLKDLGQQGINYINKHNSPQAVASLAITYYKQIKPYSE